MKVNKVYMIEMDSEDNPGPQIVGISSSEEKKDRMLATLRNTAGEDSGTKYEAYPFLVDCLIINDQPLLF